MRVLLVTWTDRLLQKLQILSPQLEYCAIVVDEVEPAQKILERVNLPKSLLRPLHELKECVNDFYYDYVICSEDSWSNNFLKIVQEYGIPKDKILALNIPDKNDFLIERSLRYFKEHAYEFEMFATGMSYAETDLDVTQFKHKLFNFGRSSQDLYYNFQIAKRAMVYGGGIGKLRYVLIELSPYKFHYDLSKSTNLQFLMPSYLIAFEDLHNFFIPIETYKGLFRKEYLESRLSSDSLDLNNPFYVKKPLCFMTHQTKLNVLKVRDGGSGKNFPDTRAENIQIFDNYLTLCEQNNIRPIIFLPPMSELYMKLYSKSRIDEFRYLVNQACRKHPSAVFLDGWQLRGLTDRDFYDYGHMNIQGAAKFSAWLNHFIEQLEGKR